MQSSLMKKWTEKLKPCFYGPYKVVRKVGEVAYELELPEESKIHNVFHVSNLKKTIGKHISPPIELAPLDDEGLLILVPERIIQTRERKLRNRVIREYLVQWKELPLEDAICEGEHVLQHPSLQLLEDKQSQVGRTVKSSFA